MSVGYKWLLVLHEFMTQCNKISTSQKGIDEFQINADLRTSGFDNEVLSVDACAVWWERESFYCLPRISVVTWHREPRFQCGSARTCSIWNSSIPWPCLTIIWSITVWNISFKVNLALFCKVLIKGTVLSQSEQTFIRAWNRVSV